MNHKYKLGIAVIVSTSISGCSSIVRNGGGIERTNIDYPPIGVETVAYVGDEMLAKGVKTTINAIRLNNSVQVGSTYSYTFAPGIYTQTGHDNGKVFYSPTLPGMVQDSLLADRYSGMYVTHDTNELCAVSIVGTTVCDKVDYEPIKHTTTSMESFQQTLLYSGRIGNKINISYREFQNNQARPAFSNDVEYDIGESKIIGYKGAQLEIINANNNSIKYKVLRNFR